MEIVKQCKECKNDFVMPHIFYGTNCTKCFNIKRRQKDKTKYKENTTYRMKINTKNTIAYEQNKEQIFARRAIFKEENYDDILLKAREKYRIKVQTDPGFVAFECARKRMQKYHKKLKTKNFEEFFGCSQELYFKWFDFLLEKSGLKWEDYGGDRWHIDHLIPCKIFDFSNPASIKDCFHWSNLRPLGASENHSKHSKIVIDEINEHFELLKTFCELNELTDNHLTFERMIKELG